MHSEDGTPRVGPAAGPDTALGRAVVDELVLPASGNHHGTMFAGAAMTLVIRAAYIAAARAAGRLVVLAAVEQVDFRAPVPIGSVVRATAEVVSRGRRSMRVHVTIAEAPDAQDPPAGEPAVEGTLVMVAEAED